MASHAENVSIWWRHHDIKAFSYIHRTRILALLCLQMSSQNKICAETLFARPYSFQGHVNRSHDSPNTRIQSESPLIFCERILPVTDDAKLSQLAKFKGPTWGPPGSCRPQMGLMLASWTLLSEFMLYWLWIRLGDRTNSRVDGGLRRHAEPLWRHLMNTTVIAMINDEYLKHEFHISNKK